jgi:hypothetical protein
VELGASVHQSDLDSWSLLKARAAPAVPRPIVLLLDDLETLGALPPSMQLSVRRDEAGRPALLLPRSGRLP